MIFCRKVMQNERNCFIPRHSRQPLELGVSEPRPQGRCAGASIHVSRAGFSSASWACEGLKRCGEGHTVEAWPWPSIALNA